MTNQENSNQNQDDLQFGNLIVMRSMEHENHLSFIYDIDGDELKVLQVTRHQSGDQNESIQIQPEDNTERGDVKKIESCSCGQNGRNPQTDYIMGNTFWIGVYPGMTHSMLDYIISTMDQFIQSIGA